jgi:pSer/pThr/pTyr-binding forkhead associated (FHA) protein
VITLSLLHPVKQIPVQVWSFPNEPIVRIGRSSDNQVVLYSAVVSRYHVELRQSGSTWEVFNSGTNGTYVDGKRVTQMAIADGAVIRLARSGPNIQVNLGVAQSEFPLPTTAVRFKASDEMLRTSCETSD